MTSKRRFLPTLELLVLISISVATPIGAQVPIEGPDWGGADRVLYAVGGSEFSPGDSSVEALADSGITAGCGGGNFCPDQPLTRGQMAVFLSIALGLHFPN